MSIVTVGIDLAKNVFAIHGVNETGKAIMVKPKVSRDQLVVLIAQLPPCLIGMEACAEAHHVGRQLAALGHGPLDPGKVCEAIGCTASAIASASRRSFLCPPCVSSP